MVKIGDNVGKCIQISWNIDSYWFDVSHDASKMAKQSHPFVITILTVVLSILYSGMHYKIMVIYTNALIIL